MAGLSAAYWFSRLGHDVTVVERSDGLRLGGAPIDVRGPALGTAERMGILDAIAARRVPRSAPRRVLDAQGSQVATMDLTWFANETDDDIEISRDDLNQLLLEAVGDSVEIVFDETIISLRDDASTGVDVTLSDGSTTIADLVVGADGLHSNVRRLAFGREEQFLRHLGLYVALLDLDPSQDWDGSAYSVPGLSVGIRTELERPLVFVMFRSPPLDHDHRDLVAQRGLVVDALGSDDVWELPRVREQFRDEGTRGFYFDTISQTRMSSWCTGRTALIGDAAHCAALLSGMGTSLAMTAAEFLATEVSRTPDDLRAAFARFEEQQRPLVDKAQASVTDNGAMMVPATTADLERRNALLRELAAAHG